jgi:hypothetical protein
MPGSPGRGPPARITTSDGIARLRWRQKGHRAPGLRFLVTCRPADHRSNCLQILPHPAARTKQDKASAQHGPTISISPTNLLRPLSHSGGRNALPPSPGARCDAQPAHPWRRRLVHAAAAMAAVAACTRRSLPAATSGSRAARGARAPHDGYALSNRSQESLRPPPPRPPPTLEQHLLQQRWQRCATRDEPAALAAPPPPAPAPPAPARPSQA